jgi:hypothetical protein
MSDRRQCRASLNQQIFVQTFKQILQIERLLLLLLTSIPFSLLPGCLSCYSLNFCKFLSLFMSTFPLRIPPPLIRRYFLIISVCPVSIVSFSLTLFPICLSFNSILIQYSSFIRSLITLGQQHLDS